MKRLIFPLIVLLFITGTVTAAPSSGEVITNTHPYSWVVDGGFLYFSTNCDQAGVGSNAYLYRIATTGRDTQTLESIRNSNQLCYTFAGLAADDEGVYSRFYRPSIHILYTSAHASIADNRRGCCQIWRASVDLHEPTMQETVQMRRDDNA